MAEPSEASGGWVWYAVGSAVFAAATALLGKLGVAGVPENLAVFVRTAVVLLFTAAVVTARSEWVRPDGVSTRGVLLLVASGVATALSWLCYFHALRSGPVSRVAPVDKLSVVLVIAFATLLLGEPLSWRLAVGGLLVTSGVVLVAWR